MSTPEVESGCDDADGPQHPVQLEGFFMSQTPIIQEHDVRWGRELEPGAEPRSIKLSGRVRPPAGRSEEYCSAFGGEGELVRYDGVLPLPDSADGSQIHIAERGAVVISMSRWEQHAV